MGTITSARDLSLGDEKFFNTSARSLQDLLAPLFSETPINFFVYGRFYKNGKSIVLNTHPEVTKYHLDNDLKFINAFPVNPSDNKLLFCPKSEDIYGTRYDSIQEIFDHSYPIDFVEFHEDYFDFFCYASAKGQGDQTNFYMSNLERLKFQNLYIRKQATKIIETAQQDHYFQIPQLVDADCFSYCRQHVPEKVRLANEFLQQQFKLSKRELDVLRLHSYGASAKEAARELVISVKTVDSHIRNIKDKIQIEKKHDLIRFYLDLLL